MKKFRLLLSMLAATAVMFTACQPGAETPEDPNPDQGTETPENPGGETPDTPDTPVTPAGPTVVEFVVDATVGNGELTNSMSLADRGLPGHMFMLSAMSYNEETEMMVPCGEAMLMMFDFDYQANGCLTYSYLTGHHYPVVAGFFEGGNIPTKSCVLADQGGYSFFSINGVDYQIVVPETATDAEGNPYGVTVEYHPGLTMQDLNLLVFNIPAQDPEGNKVIIRGSYTGPLGYQLGGGGGAQQTLPFDLGQYGFTTFEAEYNTSANLLVLKSSSMNGNLRLNFDLDTTNGLFLDQRFDCVEGGGALTGFFWEQMDDVDYTVDSGTVVVSATETPGQYTLTASTRNPVVFWGQRFIYELQGDYTVTINGLPEGL